MLYILVGIQRYSSLANYPAESVRGRLLGAFGPPQQSLGKAVSEFPPTTKLEQILLEADTPSLQLSTMARQNRFAPILSLAWDELLPPSPLRLAPL